MISAIFVFAVFGLLVEFIGIRGRGGIFLGAAFILSLCAVQTFRRGSDG